MTKKDNILFSVILPVYNDSEKIISSINSVMNQSFEKWELIIIENGSNLLNKENLVSDNRIELYHLPNPDRSLARNFGIRNSKGTHITFIDADDTWDKDHLESVFSVLQKNPDAIVVSDYFVPRENEDFEFRNAKYFKGKELEWVIKYGTIIFSVAKEAFEDNMFPSHRKEDKFVLTKLITKRRIHFTNKVTYNYFERVESPISKSDFTEHIHAVDLLDDLYKTLDDDLQKQYSLGRAKFHLLYTLFLAAVKMKNCLTAKKIVKSSDFKPKDLKQFYQYCKSKYMLVYT